MAIKIAGFLGMAFVLAVIGYFLHQTKPEHSESHKMKGSH